MALSSAAGLDHLESYSGVAHATLARNVNVVRPRFALFDPDHLALVPQLLRPLDLLHTHTMPLSLHSRTLISPTHVAARLAGCARARTHLAQPRASPTLLAGHAVVEGVPARRRADQSRTSHSTQWSVEDLLRLGMFCGPRLAALAGGDPVVVAPLAGAVAAGGEGSTIVCAFEAWSARQRVTYASVSRLAALWGSSPRPRPTVFNGVTV